jgi:hypothetical protein
MRNDLASIALRAVVRVMGERSPVTYRRGASSWPVRGVYQDSHIGLDPETGIQVRSTQPVMLIDGTELPVAPQQDDVVEVRGAQWRVRDPQPDGHTGWLLMLHRLPVQADTIGLIYANTIIRATTTIRAAA